MLAWGARCGPHVADLQDFGREQGVIPSALLDRPELWPELEPYLLAFLQLDASRTRDHEQAHPLAISEILTYGQHLMPHVEPAFFWR